MESTQNERSSVLSRYFSEIREYPLLTKEEEMSLARKVKLGRRESLNELVESNLSFVVKVAVPPLQWPTKMEVSHQHFVQVTREPVFIAPVQPLRPGALPAEKAPQDYGAAETERPEIKWSCFRKDQERDRTQFPEPFPAPTAVPPDAHLYEKSIRSPRPLARPLSIETIGLTRIARIEINPVRP